MGALSNEKIKVDPDFKFPDDGRIKPEEKPVAVATALSAHIDTCYSESKQSKENTGINKRLLDCLRQYEGEYDAETSEKIKQMGGSNVFRKLTMMKCDSCAAWLEDIMNSVERRPWRLEPTPMPDLPEDVQEMISREAEMEVYNEFPPEITPNGEMLYPPEAQQVAYDYADKRAKQILDDARKLAKSRAKLMGDEMADQMLEGNWPVVFSNFILEFSIFPNAILKGPILRMEKVRKWDRDEMGKVKAVIKTVPTIQFENVSMFDLFPSPAAKGIQDGYLIEKIQLTRNELRSLKPLDGYSEEEIDAVLNELNNSESMSDYDDEHVKQERAELENRESSIPNNASDNKLRALEFWGHVPGYMLKDWGLEVEDVLADYSIHALMVNNHVVKAVLNEDPLDQRPYAMASFKVVPGSFWGMSLPETMADIQRSCNASIRALVNNLGLASGPMVGYDISQLPAGQNITSMRPWKVYQFDGARSPNGRKAVEFFNPPSNANELLGVYNEFKREAGDVTNIPNFAHGDANVGGAGDTASGLAMLQGNATKQIKKLLNGISMNVLKPTLRRLYDWNMVNNDKDELKGDCEIDVRGPLDILAREQVQLRLSEFLAMTNNPTDIEIMGLERRRNLLARRAELMNLPVDEVVPGEEEFNKQQQEKQMMAQQQMEMQAIAASAPEQKAS